MTTLGVKYNPLRSEIEELQPKTYIEVGVYRLETFKSVSEEFDISSMIGFDLFNQAPNNEEAPVEGPPLPLSAAQELVPEAVFIQGDSKETLLKLELMNLKPPVLAFVDGGHSYETIKTDIANLLRVLPTGSVIIVDDGPMSGVKKALKEFDGVIDMPFGLRKLVVK